MSKPMIVAAMAFRRFILPWTFIPFDLSAIAENTVVIHNECIVTDVEGYGGNTVFDNIGILVQTLARVLTP
jgi:hypothetical protein